MSKKTYCDLCEKEIKEIWLDARFDIDLEIREWHESDTSMPWTYIGAARGDKVVMHLCSDCKAGLIKSALIYAKKIKKARNLK
jgi:hypothetical protein